MNISLELDQRRTRTLEVFAADMGVSPEDALQAIVEAALSAGAPEARVRLGVRARRQRIARISMADVRRVTADGASLHEAATALGVSKSTVSRRMKAFGITSLRRAHYPAPRRAEVVEAMRNGLNNAPDIAARIGAGRQVVLQALLRLEESGVVRRLSPQAGGKGRPSVRFAFAEAAQ